MTKIYKLLDPDTKEVRYVGKTVQTLKKRLSGHITRSKYNRSAHVSCWIHSLIQNGKKPIIELIEECENWVKREQYYIAKFPNLCNHSIGGESGMLGYIPTQEHRDKIANKLKGKKRPDNVRKKISEGHKGKIISQKTRDKLRKINLGKKEDINIRLKKAKSPVLQFNLDGSFVKEWGSLGLIQETTGFLKSNISSCCHGRLKTAYNYKWSFKNEDIV